LNLLDKKFVLIIAAEESSTLYAKRILQNWKSRGLNIHCYGVGNQDMADLGFERLADSTEMAVVGLSEILKHWDKIKSTYKNVLDRTKKEKPAFALLLDYPGFNLRLAKSLKAQGIKVIYYISPQLWAWKQSRVKKVKKYCDRMLVLFPFEKEFYESHGYQADYVGHPIIDEIQSDLLDHKKQLEERQRYGIRMDEQLVGIMPGSRRGEIKLNLPVQLEAIHQLHTQKPNLKFALLLAPNLRREDLDLSSSAVNIQIIQKDPFEMIGYCDAILCASGTATLMVGLLEKPMVIMYKMNPFSGWLAKRLVKIKYFGLVNVIAQREVAPERFQSRATATELSKLLFELLFDIQIRAKSIEELKHIKQLLGGGGATERVIKILDEYLA